MLPSTCTFLHSKQLFDIRHSSTGRSTKRKTLHGNTVTTNQTLLKIPRDRTRNHRFDVVEDRIILRTADLGSKGASVRLCGRARRIYIRFRGERERSIHEKNKVLDLLIGAWFLIREFIARNTKNFEATGLILLINQGKLDEVPQSVASVAGSIYDQGHFPAKLGKSQRSSINIYGI